MTNLPFVFSKYQTTLLHEIYTVCQYFDSLCSKQIHTTREKKLTIVKDCGSVWCELH